MIVDNNLGIEEKLAILADAAKFDVACTSSGSDRKNKGAGLGNTVSAGICHSFSGDGRCISLLKILFTNECIFDCKYCINRSSNDVPRATFTPEEVAQLTVEFYKRNYIEGLFLSSGIIRTPNNTSELLFETMYLLRIKYSFNGYIHIKMIPGTDEELIDKIGWFADRMSINLELPTTEGLKQLAPHKTRGNILRPMRRVQQGTGMISSNEELFQIPPFTDRQLMDSQIQDESDHILKGEIVNAKQFLWKPKEKRIFTPAGQSTQMIVGATRESDYQIMKVTEGLYNNFNLKRVFYSAFVNVNQDSQLPSTEKGPELLREHRLYQADWLLRFYGFQADELLNEKKQNFNVHFDPKCDWALSNLESFPVEIQTASYQMLLRVPGIGVRSAQRIVAARRHGKLEFDHLKKMGVVLKRAVYFITCQGKMKFATPVEENFISRQLLADDNVKSNHLLMDCSYQQLSLFDLPMLNEVNEMKSSGILKLSD